MVYFQLSRILTGVIKCWYINYNNSLHNLDFWLSEYIICDKKKENMKCKYINVLYNQTGNTNIITVYIK